MKRAIIVIMLTVIVFVLQIGAYAEEVEQKDKLSELSDDACIAFLKDSGVTIPNIYNYEDQCIPFARTVIAQVEENPCAEFYFSMQELLLFANEIKQAVNCYYGITEMESINQRDGYVLQDSYVYGGWSDSYLYYNCYGYAIGYDGFINPGHIAWMNDGNAFGSYQYNATAKMLIIVGLVKRDLEVLGYTVSMPTTTKPNTVASAHNFLICFRRDETSFDFHLMKLGQDGNWYHKPGGTNPLRYKHTPSVSREWLCEGYDGAKNEFFLHTQYLYDSTIYYIQYSTAHEWSYSYYGSDKHVATCTICGDTSEPASCIYINNVCRVCGHCNSHVDLNRRFIGCA